MSMRAVQAMQSSAQDIRPDQVEDILKGIAIPSPPQVLLDLQRQLQQPDPDLVAMAHSISQDVGLAGSVLKTVNSPLYGLSAQVTSISRAVNLLGIDTIVNLVNSYCVRNETLSRGLSKQDVDSMTRFWDSAIDVANCAMLIAREVNYPAPDHAYMLGLFHNAGIPLLQQRFPNYPAVQIAAYAQPEGRLTAVENAEMHTSHQVMSYYVAKTWKLPTDVSCVIRNHHALERLTDIDNPDLHQLAAILKLAEHIVGLHRILGDQADDHEWHRLSDYVSDTLHLDADDIADIHSQASELGIGQLDYYL